MTPITVTPVPTTSPARVEIIWEAVSQNLCCTIEYPEKALVRHELTPLRDFLDAQWPTAQRRRMIIGGQFSMVLDSETRLHDFDIRADFTERVLQPIARGDAIYMEPCIHAAFDNGGDAKCLPIEEALFDPEQRIVCLSWGVVDHWCVIAPTLSLGLAPDGELMKIQISDFLISAPEPRPESSWERLKRRFMPPADRAR
jgi:hypothetical protein